MFDRAKIMKAAWQIARNCARFYRETLAKGRRHAWADAKTDARVARIVAAQMAAVAALARRPIAALRASVARIETMDFHASSDRADLVTLRHAIAAAWSSTKKGNQNDDPQRLAQRPACLSLQPARRGLHD